MPIQFNTLQAMGADARSIYRDFYSQYTVGRTSMRLLANRALYFDPPSELDATMQLIVHEVPGQIPLSHSRPQDPLTGKDYDCFTYDAGVFDVFTATGTAIRHWHQKRAAIHIPERVNGIDRPFVKDGVPIYQGDWNVHLELQAEDDAERAWLEVSRFSNSGSLRLERTDGLGWILPELISKQVQRMLTTSDNSFAAKTGQAA